MRFFVFGEKDCSYSKRNRAEHSPDSHERMDLALKTTRKTAEIMELS